MESQKDSIGYASELIRLQKRVMEDEKRDRMTIQNEYFNSQQSCCWCNDSRHDSANCDREISLAEKTQLIFKEKICCICLKRQQNHLPPMCFKLLKAKEEIGRDRFGKVVYRNNPLVALCGKEECLAVGRIHANSFCPEIEKEKMWEKYGQVAPPPPSQQLEK